MPAASTRLLSLLDELGPSTIGDLATADGCSQPTMSGLVKGIDTRGWVRRTAHPQDARSEDLGAAVALLSRLLARH